MVIKVVIVDDHPALRMGLHLLLDNTPDIDLVGDAGSGFEALKLLTTQMPDILLLDYRLPDMPGSHVSAQVRMMNWKTRVLVFSGFSDEEYIFKMLEAGAHGYVLKTESPMQLLDAIRAVARGETWISPGIASMVLSRSKREFVKHTLLSHRELEVLQLLARGFSNTQIANRLTISRATVKNHLSNIYSDLSVSSRSEAISWAWTNGVMGREPSEV